MKYCPIDLLQIISNHFLGEAEFFIVHVLHMYNFFPPMTIGDRAVTTFCGILPPFCNMIVNWLSDGNGVDNPDRFNVYMSNLPSGSSYRTFVYYG